MELRCIRLVLNIGLGLVPLLPGAAGAVPPGNNEFAPPGKWLGLADRFYAASMDPDAIACEARATGMKWTLAPTLAVVRTNGSCAGAINVALDVTPARVRAGDITLARIEDTDRRILRVKLRAHLFDRDRPSPRPLSGKFDGPGSPWC